MSGYNWLEAIDITADRLKGDCNERLPVIWVSALECTGCKEALIRSAEPTASELLLDFISLEYSELFSVASGDRIESHKQTIFEKYKGKYVLVIEGSVPGNSEFLMIAGKSVRDEIQEAAMHAKAVIAVGSCSAWGGLPAASPNPTDSEDISALIPEVVPLALVPGCPPVPEAITGTLLYIHFHGELPELDKKLRPKMFYNTTVHMACHRKPFFDQKLFAESFDDEGAKKGYCLFKLGCKGPTAFNACESLGIDRCIQAGIPCMACSEKGFWDKGGFTGKKKKRT
ncbi:hydrogenase small subunit [Mesobacillus zeae]|uniref:[NiFe] hydrogenase small subunit HydA n=1 Tax=Mesobacillus zeae TaxID=1917180 RepID=A0A398BEQ7_9BACI|nr:hydrogenase small subunit [Mesobacillus zeae]RID87751.1 [NiFe] hydrogenase small subunit HydA [Mesobacillus zeae]